MSDSSEWKSVITKAWKNRSKDKNPPLLSLVDEGFDEQEVLAMVEVILSGQITMNQKTFKFEDEFAKFIGSKYAVFVNSGSSANLLAVACAFYQNLFNGTDPNYGLVKDCEVLVPAVCWSTSVWPVVQCGMVPIFVDVDPYTLNIDLEDMKKKITKKTRGVIAVHILGNATDMKEFMAITKKHNLVVIEDTCESLGSKSGDKCLGTFGDYGTYSFFFSHHMTTGEGGMVVCNKKEDYDLLLSMRAHGWSRMLQQKDKENVEKLSPDIDPRFLFINTGFNLRPTDVAASMGLVQLKKLPEMNENRIKNRANLIKALEAHKKWDKQLVFPTLGKGMSYCVWFGFCFLVVKGNRDKLIKYLSEKRVENRPVVSGNFVRQPALKKLGYKLDPKDFPGAEKINNIGMFIGLHATLLSEKNIKEIADVIMDFDFSS